MNALSEQKLLCSIYKSPKKEGMYLYVPKDKQLEDVPKVLITQMGHAEHVMDLLLTPEKKLARANARDVMEKLNEQGFYVQMPPQDNPQF